MGGRIWRVEFMAAAIGLTGSIGLVAAANAARDRHDTTPVQPHLVRQAESFRPDPGARRAFFGELHLHTTMSFDAWTFGTKVTPDQAYKFARGEQVMVPAVQVEKEQKLPVTGPVPARRAWPLDFAAVTDHSEYLGAMSQLDFPQSAFANTPFGRQILAGGRQAYFAAVAAVTGESTFASADLKRAAEASDGWNVEMKAANDNYQPGRFTTFVAYEWSASPGNGIHMHRNVIFSGSSAPPPFSSLESNNPEDLWKYMRSARARGFDVLAIPHNSNLSDGRDFDWNMSDGRPIDAMYAVQRSINEPLVEIAQTKGASETTPDLSPTDEFANFEIMTRIYKGETAPKEHGSYVREAYGRGLIIAARVGANPFKMGVVGSSDIHNGLSASDESAFASGSGGLDPATMRPTGAAAESALGMASNPLQVRPSGQRENDPLQFSSGAITGVWAEENTRSAIFAALKRKETFATSGTRIRLRMFASWKFENGLLRKRDWARRAYAEGVPMGGDLPKGPRGAAPTFVVQASKDPAGANLDRIQIIKIWRVGGGYREKIYNVALSDGRSVNPKTGSAKPVGNTVDLRTGSYTNSIGSAELTATWRDPDYRSNEDSLYYARVLEIPTPRWSTLLAISNHLTLPQEAPKTIQERAWSSPIWMASNY